MQLLLRRADGTGVRESPPPVPPLMHAGTWTCLRPPGRATLCSATTTRKRQLGGGGGDLQAKGRGQQAKGHPSHELQQALHALI